MVPAQELRKGNCLMFDNTVCYVSQILHDKVELVTNEATNNTYSECEYSRVNPIPLTVDVLEKCDFIKQERFHYSNVFYSREGNFIINQLRDSLEISYGLDGNLAIVSKRDLSLHQLQNLYFALTTTELKVKL
jgi:hypothetical protein